MIVSHSDSFDNASFAISAGLDILFEGHEKELRKIASNVIDGIRDQRESFSVSIFLKHLPLCSFFLFS